MADAEEPDARRQAAFAELSASLEQISVKTIIELRGFTDVSPEVEATAAAVLCMIARIDDTVVVGADDLPARTWAAAKESMAKPGHFINALRRFPYAVDSGRMPRQNVVGAKSCIGGLTLEDLAAHGVAQKLFRWLFAAMSYWETVNDQKVEQVDKGQSMALTRDQQAEVAQDVARDMAEVEERAAVDMVQAAVGSVRGGDVALAEAELAAAADLEREAMNETARAQALSRQRADRGKQAPAQGQVAKCPCGNIFAEGSEFCRKCGQKRSQVRGLAPARAPAPPGATGVTVRVVAAAGLTNTDGYRSGRSDTFCVVKLGETGEEQKTSVVAGDLNPVWNEEFSFSLTGKNVGWIEFEVRGSDEFSSTKMSSARMQLSELPPNTACSLEQDHLDEQGNILGRLTLEAVLEVDVPGSLETSQVSSVAKSPPKRAPRPAPPPAPPVVRLSRVQNAAAQAVSGRRSASRPEVPPQDLTLNASVNSSTNGRLQHHQIGMAEFQKMVQQQKREARDMKATEARIKITMDREDKALRVSTRKQNIKEITEWRTETRESMNTYVAARKVDQKQKELVEAREFQDFKKERKQMVRDADQQIILEDYVETKEVSGWEVEQKREAQVQKRSVVYDNLEKYRLFRDYGKSEADALKMDDIETAELERQLQMDYMTLQAQQEKEIALGNLEHTRQVQADIGQRQPIELTGDPGAPSY